jgi:hypothetical protein
LLEKSLSIDVWNEQGKAAVVVLTHPAWLVRGGAHHVPCVSWGSEV